MNNDTTIVLNKNLADSLDAISGEIDTTELKPVISVISGKDKGKNFIIDKPDSLDRGKPVTLGRGNNVDCRVQDEMISRTHLLINYENDTFHIEDLNSKNGSYIDENKIKDVSVVPGTVVNIGNSMLVLSLKSETQLNAEKELYQAATIDVLTQISNRSWFMKRASEEFSYAQIKHMPISIIMMDIDHFKRINDSYGHQGGDYVLKETASLMQQQIRDNDLLGRYGGEEFIIFLKGVAHEKSSELAERIRLAIANQKLVFNNKEIHASISIGLCTLENPYNIALEDVIALADKQLYISKNNGRNQVNKQTI
ncbi:MAG: GGDEF domain-containing protein [Gammaproteobacteria bacterium]|nr:GGDEF domain-containing protein [Gammaproteobacteria bacterium]